MPAAAGRIGGGGTIRHAQRWRAALLILGLLTLVLLLYTRVRQTGFHWSRFAATFAGAHWDWLAGSLGFCLLTYLGRAIRWRVIILPLQPDVSFWRLLKANILGFTAVVLFGRPGELVRPYLIATWEKVSFASQMAAWVLERIYDLLAVLLIFGLALAQLHSSPAAASLTGSLRWVFDTGGAAIAFLSAVCLVLLVFFGLFAEVAQRRLRDALGILPEAYQGHIERVVASFLAGAQSTRRLRSVVALLSYTLLEWVLIVASFLCFFRGFQATAAFGLIDSLAVLGFVAFGSIVQIPGVGGGVQIVSILVLTELFGVPLESATGIGIALWLVHIAHIVPFGLLLALREGIRFSLLRDVGQVAKP